MDLSFEDRFIRLGDTIVMNIDAEKISVIGRTIAFITSRRIGKSRYIPFGAVAKTGLHSGVLHLYARLTNTAKPIRLIVIGYDRLGALIPSANYDVEDICSGARLQSPRSLSGVYFTTESRPDASCEFDAVQAGTDFSLSIRTAPIGSRFEMTGIARILNDNFTVLCDSASEAKGIASVISDRLQEKGLKCQLTLI